MICLLLLAFSGFLSFPESKYYSEELKVLVKSKEAQVIEVGKSMKIDNDTLYIKRIVNTQEQTFIRYGLLRSEQGWSFSEGALKIFDDCGREYQSIGGGSSGKSWGQEGLIKLDRINKDSKQITLKLDWYDRKGELTISLKKDGEINDD
jgi:hypothetical protein